MISQRLHNRLGTTGLIVAIMALIVALGGGAYAASGALTGKQKKEVEKIAKKYAGKPGKPGATGPQGAAGKDGSRGADGSKGADGANGTSVTSKAVAVGAPACEGRGGSEFTSASGATFTCAGEEGPEGPEGSPWVVNGLPAGATETGTFAAGEFMTEQPTVEVPISFNVPLAAGTNVPVFLVNINGKEEETNGTEATPVHCLGSTSAPTAPAGTLCIYESTRGGMHFGGVGNPTGGLPERAGLTGAILIFSAEEESHVNGDWAVTAPAP